MSGADWEKFSATLKMNVPWDLFTVLDVDWTNQLVRRSFSSNEKHYPSGGVKHLMKSAWADQVIVRQQCFISREMEEFRNAFADHQLLEQLGLLFALNVPLVVGGQTVQTINLLSAVSPYTDIAAKEVRRTASLLGLQSADLA